MLKQNKLAAMSAMALAAVITINPMSVFAADVIETQQITDENKTAQCTVTIDNTASSTFTVTVPKEIVGSGESGVLDYEVTVEGDFAGNQYVDVVPDATVTLKQDRKDDVVANITQDKTKWYIDEIATKGNGTITYSGIKAGTYEGQFNFDISMNTEASGD